MYSAFPEVPTNLEGDRTFYVGARGKGSQVSPRRPERNREDLRSAVQDVDPDPTPMGLNRQECRSQGDESVCRKFRYWEVGDSGSPVPGRRTRFGFLVRSPSPPSYFHRVPPYSVMWTGVHLRSGYSENPVILGGVHFGGPRFKSSPTKWSLFRLLTGSDLLKQVDLEGRGGRVWASGSHSGIWAGPGVVTTSLRLRPSLKAITRKATTEGPNVVLRFCVLYVLSPDALAHLVESSVERGSALGATARSVGAIVVFNTG